MVLAACGAPRAVVRPAPVRPIEAAFLVVSNQSTGPVAIGSPRGLWVTLSGGRRWTLQHPDSGPVRAIGFVGDTAWVSRGSSYTIYDRALQHVLVPTQPWPFPGDVGAMAYELGNGRMWAFADDQLWYNPIEGRPWRRRTAIGLCPKPVAFAATRAMGGGDGVVRLLAACGDAGLYASDDLGQSFFRLPAPTTAIAVATTSADAGLVLVASPEVLISHDRGASFSKAPLSASLVALDTRNTRVMYALAVDGFLHISIDGGHTF